MQTAAADVMDISGESGATKKLYGIDDAATKDYGTRCLIARRLVERGVRFVQVFTKNQYLGSSPRKHQRLPARFLQKNRPTHGRAGEGFKRPRPARQHGRPLGRRDGPAAGGPEYEKSPGRDHNTYGFSMWLAGGGFKAGHIHGETDEWGHRSVRDKVNHYDYHATLLRLFGLDHDHLNYKRGGRVQSLIDGQPARVVEEIMA